MILSIAHLYELFRLHPHEPEHPQAFCGALYKAAIEASRNNGAWDMSWPLLGLEDPDETQPTILSGSERVAVPALVREQQVLKAASKKYSTPTLSDNNRRPPGTGAGAKGEGKTKADDH